MTDFDVVDALAGFAEDLESNVSFAKRLHAAVVKMKQERDAAIARAIAAEQMVAELRAMLMTGRDIVIETSTGSRHTQWVEQAYDTIEASAHITGNYKDVTAEVIALREERDEALRLLATRVEAKRLDEAQEEIAALRAKVRTITDHYKPGWVDGLKAVARSAGFDPDDAPHDGVDPPTFIQDVIDMLRRDVRDLKAENERLAEELKTAWFERDEARYGLLEMHSEREEARDDNERLREVLQSLVEQKKIVNVREADGTYIDVTAWCKAALEQD